MRSRAFYRPVIALLIVSTLTCNLVMATFLHRFFYGDVKAREPATLYRLASSLGTHGNLGFPDYREILESTDAFDRLGAAMIRRGDPVYVDGTVRWANIAWATGSFHQVIDTGGLSAGRFFGEREDSPGAAKVTVVSRSMWERISPGEAFQPGRQILVKANAFEVIGVVQNDYPFLDSMGEVDIWIPARQNPDQWQYETDDYQEYQVLARLDPTRRAVAEQQLDMALEDIHERLGFSYTADALSETEFRVRRNPGMHRLFLALFVVTGSLFTLGVVNQMLMLVSRSMAIASDLKIMIALGARPMHVLLRFARGFSGLLLAALLGVMACSWAILQVYNSVWGSQFGAVDPSQLLAPQALALLGGLAMLLVLLHLGFPAAMYVGSGDNLMTRDRGAGSRFSIKNALSAGGVVLQLALVAFTILGSGAFLQSLSKEGSVRAGPHDDRLLAVEIALATRELAGPREYQARLDGIKAGLMELGGVEALGASSARPLHQGGWTRALIEGEPLEKEPEWIAFDQVDPDYFATMGLEFVAGRNVTRDEAATWPPPSYIVNEAYVEKRFSGRQALGRRIAPWEGPGHSPIVGVVQDAPLSIDGAIRPCIYIPSYPNRFLLNIRLSDASLTTTHAKLVVDRINAVDPEAVVVDVDTIETIWKEELAAPRLGFYILLALSAVGLLLAMSGVFGYQVYTMLLREREFAIRHALGQSLGSLYLGETRRGLAIVALGLAAGVGLFYAGLRVFGAYFFSIALSPVGIVALASALAALFAAAVAVASLAAARPKLSMLMRE